MERSIDQLKHYQSHYKNVYYHAKTRGKPVVKFQIRKLTQQIKQLHNLADHTQPQFVK